MSAATALNHEKGSVSATIQTIAAVIQEVWKSLHRAGRVRDFSRDGRDRIHQALGAFEMMWSLLTRHDRPHFRNREEAVASIESELTNDAAVSRLADIFFPSLLAALVSRRNAVLREVGRAKSERQRARHRNAADVLAVAFWRLASLPVFGFTSARAQARALSYDAWWVLVSDARSLKKQFAAQEELSEFERRLNAILPAYVQALGRGVVKSSQARTLKLKALGVVVNDLAQLRYELWQVEQVENQDPATVAQAAGVREKVERLTLNLLESGVF